MQSCWPAVELAHPCGRRQLDLAWALQHKSSAVNSTSLICPKLLGHGHRGKAHTPGASFGPRSDGWGAGRGHGCPMYSRPLMLADATSPFWEWVSQGAGHQHGIARHGWASLSLNSCTRGNARVTENSSEVHCRLLQGVHPGLPSPTHRAYKQKQKPSWRYLSRMKGKTHENIFLCHPCSSACKTSSTSLQVSYQKLKGEVQISISWACFTKALTYTLFSCWKLMLDNRFSCRKVYVEYKELLGQVSSYTKTVLQNFPNYSFSDASVTNSYLLWIKTCKLNNIVTWNNVVSF